MIMIIILIIITKIIITTTTTTTTIINNFLNKFSRGMSGRVVITSNSGSGDLGFKPRPSRCFLRQGTLLPFVSPHPGV